MGVRFGKERSIEKDPCSQTHHAEHGKKTVDHGPGHSVIH